MNVFFQKLKRQEEMARRQQEIQKEAEKARREAAERKFQERKANRQRDKKQYDDGSSRGSTPPPAPVRSNSPPIPTIRRSKGDNSSQSEFESGSMGFSTASEDDQVISN